MLRRAIPLLATAILFAACGGATTETTSDEATFEAVLETADQGGSAAGYLDRAPRGLQLTAEQKAAIRTINEEFRTANKADLDALTAITREAMDARRSGASRAEVVAILERSRPIRERLAPAFAALRAAISAVLTAEQRAWLANHARRLGPNLPPLPGR